MTLSLGDSMPEPDHLTLNTAAKLLGITRSMIQRAVDKKLLRSTEVPFKSNLGHGGHATQTLVVAEDVRKALRGEISLASLNAVRVAPTYDVPKTDEEVREALANIQQGIDQTQLMMSAVLERLDLVPPPPQPVVKHPKPRNPLTGEKYEPSDP